MKKFAFILLLLPFAASSFHIVGGEIEFITLGFGKYRINVIQYFDEAQELNPGPENAVTVYIFRASDDQLMSEYTLPLVPPQLPVQYTNEACAVDQLQTSKVLWSDEIDIYAPEYNDPEGYYLVWQRCCRNEAITNIIDPDEQGMTYITEIPPLWLNGAPFINSSPELFTPLNDYACQDQLYYIDFTGIDRDGDSLVYSLTTPLNTHFSGIALGTVRPKPYLPIRFSENQGYTSDNMIPGSPRLAISDRGLLTVNPTRSGLHVFAVLVEEYRHGQKIGAVQRDFQMLVLPTEQCNPPDPPQVAVQVPGFLFFNEEVDTLKYQFNEDKCFLFLVKNITAEENITLRAEGVNFEGDLDYIFDVNQTRVLDDVDSLAIEVCAPECPPTGTEPFIIDLIASDDACPLPQQDTIRLIMQVEPVPNQLPLIDIGDQTILRDQGIPFESPFTITDPDLDSVYATLTVEGVRDPSKYGFSIEPVLTAEGTYEGVIRWDTNCEAVLFDRKEFKVFIGPEDDDFCQYDNPNRVELDMRIILPDNDPVNVFVADAPEGGFVQNIDNDIRFDVIAEDPNGDIVSLYMIGDGFNPAALGIRFDSAISLGRASSSFEWDLDCSLYIPGGNNSYDFLFVGDDADLCSQEDEDVLAYTITLDVPSNEAPVLTRVESYVLPVNERFELPIEAYDPDEGDIITLEFFNGVRLPPSRTIAFETVVGQSEVNSLFTWTPECSLLENGQPTDYEVVFSVRDDACPSALVDTIRVPFRIVETRQRFDNFFPPNAFSPNDDGINEHFTFSNHTDPSLNLPIDICDDVFQYFSVHDRSGAPVFYSEDREFVWDGGDLSAGVYFYVVKFSQTEYKNYVQIIR